MILLIILAVISLLVYAITRAVRKLGPHVLWFVAAAVNFVSASGGLAEHLWGPQWSWNFAGHNKVSAWQALIQAFVCVTFGLSFRRSRPHNPPPTS